MLNVITSISQDLTGQVYSNPHYFQIQRRIRSLADFYLSMETLCDRLQDLPIQFQNPQPRPWKPIDWGAISSNQIVGLNPEVFLSILVGAIDTEAPIRGYTQTSRQYLEKLHPQLARFVGGTVNENGELIELGLWEKEERQHTPALIKVYYQLTGKKITPTFRTVRGYLPTDNPYEDLYRHGLHRVVTEYGATCLYLWLMAHTTGVLQDVLEELVWDEINHMTKFWGFGLWAFPDTSLLRIGQTLIKTRGNHYQRNSLVRTLRRMMGTLNWSSWSLTNKATLIFTFTYAMHRLWVWNNSLTPKYLQDLFVR
ncbi:MAG: ferritin-like domain-containing protein [Scytonema sp. PMC 1069.18]|nr:ferritin-like domain-containing protein [Scytonema sp. PMC 1069.18]MEC4883031.1 ferritin-like domain-containing protein [Scytonema sp. PMC 1070.18]